MAGALGPLNRTSSLSPVVEDPSFRNVTFMEMKDAYKVQIKGLVEGGGIILNILIGNYSSYYLYWDNLWYS